MKIFSAKISLYVIQNIAVNYFQIKEDIEEVIKKKRNDYESNIIVKLPFVINIFEFWTSESEEFKQRLRTYEENHADIVTFIRENKRDLQKTVKDIPRGIVLNIKRFFTPITARIFFKITPDKDHKEIVRKIRDEVLDPKDDLPKVYTLDDIDNRFRVNIKMRDFDKFNSKFKRFKIENPELDIFVAYDYQSWKSFAIQYAGYILFALLNYDKVQHIINAISGFFD